MGGVFVVVNVDCYGVFGGDGVVVGEDIGDVGYEG